LLRPVITVYP